MGRAPAASAMSWPERVGTPALLEGLCGQRRPARSRACLPEATLEAARSSVLPVVEGGPPVVILTTADSSGRAAVEPTVTTVGETPAERKMETAHF